MGNHAGRLAAVRSGLTRAAIKTLVEPAMTTGADSADLSFTSELGGA